MAEMVLLWEVLRPSYLLNLKIHLCLTFRKDQEKDQQSQTKLSLNNNKKTKKDWSNEEVRKRLYNSKHEKHYNKDEKQELRKWTESKLISHGFSEIKDLKISENITSLRSYYGIEKQKEKEHQKLVCWNLSSLCRLLEVFKRLTVFEWQFNSKKKLSKYWSSDRRGISI